MKPMPWSHSRLEDFANCPLAFHEKQVVKSVVEEKGEATLWGEQVHSHFEDRLASGVLLPAELETHEDFLARIAAMPGQLFVEERIALNLAGQPCAFFDQDVWYRGVIDVKNVNGSAATVIDHKTGKHHSKFRQLKLFAIHTFAAHPEVETIKADYYWTQTKTMNGETYLRSQVPALWATVIPDLRQYAEAFRTDTWQPRQSGLCNGWCPVTSCEFWKPKRKRA